MTDVPPTDTAPEAPPARWPRMIKVLVLLVLAMVAGYVLGSVVMTDPTDATPPRAPAGPGGGPDVGEALARAVWPEGLPAGPAWRYIVLHHSATEGATLESITRFHQERFHEDAGYHFLVNNGRSRGTADGEITPTPRWLDQRPGAHCAVEGHPDLNGLGIGVCLVGNFEHAPPTAAQMVALERLVTALRVRYRIPLEHVVAHGEVKATKCPGRMFPLESLLIDLRSSYIKQRLAP